MDGKEPASGNQWLSSHLSLNECKHQTIPTALESHLLFVSRTKPSPGNLVQLSTLAHQHAGPQTVLNSQLLATSEPLPPPPPPPNYQVLDSASPQHPFPPRLQHCHFRTQTPTREPEGSRQRAWAHVSAGPDLNLSGTTYKHQPSVTEKRENGCKSPKMGAQGGSLLPGWEPGQHRSGRREEEAGGEGLGRNLKAKNANWLCPKSEKPRVRGCPADKRDPGLCGGEPSCR